MNKHFRRILLTSLLSLALLLGSAGQAAAREIVFGDAGWDSMKFHNAVAQLIADKAFGLSTSEISGSTAITYNALKTGDIDVYMETWTDSIAPYREDVAAGKFKELGVNYDDNMQGLYVPRYVIEGDAARGIEPMAAKLRSVSDLKDYAQLFADPEEPGKGLVYGAISGWQVDDILRKKLNFYGLDKQYNYIDPGSDAALAAAIVGAYEKGEPIVAYYWEPAWITGKYDLVLLEDAPYEEDKYLLGECAFPAIRLTVAVNPDFVTEFPEFSAFLGKYSTSSALTSQALAYINDHQASYEEAARWFLSENDQLLDEWLSAEQAKLVRDAL